MKSNLTILPILLLCGSALAQKNADPPVPISISPGGIEGPTWLSDPCPTFSWGAEPNATGYELAIFWVQMEMEPSYEAQAVSAEPVLETRVAAPALSWTPCADECLEDGGSYMWFVRAIDESGPGPWSVGRQFEMDLSAGTLAEVVRREVHMQLENPNNWSPMLRKIGAELPNVTQGLASITGSPIPPDSEGSAGSPDKARGDKMPPPDREAKSAVADPKTTYPNNAALRVSSSNSVLFDDPGPIGGGIPAQDFGARFMWYAGKRALRSGYVDSSQWDDVNIGLYSTALGLSTQAKGASSTALGGTTKALGAASIALGGASTAVGDYSTAMGYYTTAESAYETVIGRYDTDYLAESTEGWSDNDRLFVIGNGESDQSRHNALIMYKDGETQLNGQLTVNGRLRVYDWASASAIDVCRNGSSLSYCSSSGRYKEAIVPLSLGLETVERLRPVTFKWKDRDERDLGFVAEEVAEIAPLLATRNDDGAIEGVKYKQLTAVLVNAIQEQQQQIALQRAEIDNLRSELNRVHELANEVVASEIELKKPSSPRGSITSAKARRWGDGLHRIE